ncbi:hypothetical protein GCM10020331_035520 [Ectobacillus funiculus]
MEMCWLIFMPDLFSASSRPDEEGNARELEEALEALKVLGYAEREINRVVPDLQKKSPFQPRNILKKGTSSSIKR